MISNNSDAHDCREVRHLNMLRKRRNREQSLRAPSAVPIREQLISMEARPFANKTESSWLETPSQNHTIN
jgi:hypothetical protein